MISKLKKFRLVPTVCFVAVALFASAPAFADTIALTFTQPNQSAKAGSVVSFYGTLRAPSTNGGTVTLNSDGATGQAFDNPPAFDDSGFLFDPNFLSIDPGQTINGLLFTITLPSSIAPGVYNSVYTILGSDVNGNDVSTARSFQITVPTSIAATPEPSTWLLLVTGVGAIAVCVAASRRSNLNML